MVEIPADADKSAIGRDVKLQRQAEGRFIRFFSEVGIADLPLVGGKKIGRAHV